MTPNEPITNSQQPNMSKQKNTLLSSLNNQTNPVKHNQQQQHQMHNNNRVQQQSHTTKSGVSALGN